MRRWGALFAVAIVVALAAAWLLSRDSVRDSDHSDGREATPDRTPAQVDADGAPETARLGSARTSKEAGRPPAPSTGRRISGRVVDANRRGIAGARVLSLPDSADRFVAAREAEKEGSPALAATADGEGRFVVPVSTDAPFFSLYAEASGFAPGAVGGQAPGAEVTIVLERPSALTGRVTDREERPIPGARVRALVALDCCTFQLEGTSDATGAYRVDGLPVAPKVESSRSVGWVWSFLYLEVSAAGFAPLFRESALFGLKPGEARTQDFVLTAGSTLTGRVVDAEDDAPIAGARVVLWSTEGSMGFLRASGVSLRNPYSPRVLGETTSGADGSFRFEHVPPGGQGRGSSMSMGQKGQIVGYVAAWKDSFAAASEEVAARADGAEAEVVLKIGAVASVSGRVVDEEGAPSAGASVVVRREIQWAQPPPPALFPDAPIAYVRSTGPDGRYRLAAPVTRSGEQTVVIEGRKTAPTGDRSVASTGTVTVTTAAGATTPAPDLVLKKPAGVLRAVVRVLGPDGGPVWGATVGEHGSAQRTDADGRAAFELPPMPEGRTRGPIAYAVRAPGLAPAQAVLTPTALGSEAEVRLQPARRLTGVVLDVAGTPRAGASVSVANGTLPVSEALPDEGPIGPMRPRFRHPVPDQPLIHYGSASTGADGTFAVEDLPEGPYHVSASVQRRSGGWQAKPLRTVVSGVSSDSDVRIVLPVDDSPPTGGLEGTLVDAETGKPVGGFTVTLRRGTLVGGYAIDGQGSMPSALAHGRATGPGRFSIPDAPAGSWTFEAKVPGRPLARREGVEVRAGETRTLDPIALGWGIVVTGRATAPGGHALKDRSLRFVGRGSIGAQVAESFLLAADGSYRATGLVAGRYLVQCWGSGLVISGQAMTGDSLPLATRETLEVPEGATELRFDLALVPGGLLQFIPEDPRLPPVGGGEPATDEQRAFGDACRVELRRDDGVVLAEQEGLYRGYGGAVSHLFLVPGRYVMRFELPGQPPRDVGVDMEAGKLANVAFPR